MLKIVATIPIIQGVDAGQLLRTAEMLNSHYEYSSGDESMRDPNRRNGTGLGGFIFFQTLVVTVLFFWWLLIFDHGVASLH